VIAMNWVHVTQKIARSFDLPGCFLLSREQGEWVGHQPPRSFREFLAEQMRTRPATYFDAVRFFKLSREHLVGEAAYMALMPIKLAHVPYQFLGLMYGSPDKLQELLRFRILPMYLLFYLHQMVAEARVRNAASTNQKALLRALEEKRLYASQLEQKVRNLNGELDRLSTAEMSMDQKLAQMRALLESHARDYTELTEAYRELYQNFEESQREQLESAVALEIRLHELERERDSLRRALADTHGESLVPRDMVDQARVAVQEARQEQARLAARIAQLEADPPADSRRLEEKIKALKQQVSFYRNRSSQLSTRLEQLQLSKSK